MRARSLAELSPDWVANSYGGNLPRLRQVKQHYDPESVFTATPIPV